MKAGIEKTADLKESVAKWFLYAFFALLWWILYF